MHAILVYWLRLLFESGDYFFQLCWKCGDNSRAATNRERRLIERIRYRLCGRVYVHVYVFWLNDVCTKQQSALKHYLDA